MNTDFTARCMAGKALDDVAGKQDKLTTEQLTAVNSGVTSTDVDQIKMNKNNILFKADKTTTDSLQAQINTINENIYDFTPIPITGSYQKFWAFETGYAVLTNVAGTEWTAVTQPIAVQTGEIYRITGNQGASHKVRTWIITDNNMKVIATAADHYESPNAGTLYTDVITIPEGGTKLVLTSTHYADSPYFWLYKVVSKEKPLEGLKLSLLGDSISAYAGTIPTGNEAYYTGNNAGVSSASQMWWNVLCTETGMTPLIINAWSGSGITQLTDSSHSGKTPMSAISRCQALNNGATNPDVILIAGGVNDYTYAEQSSQTPSNWNGSIAPVDGHSFDETYAVMIKNIQTAYPKAIVVCLSTWFTMRGTDNGYTLLNGEGLTQADYDRTIAKVAELMRVPFISVDTCGFSRSNFYPTYAEDSSTIPTHPNRNGQKVMGEYLANVLPAIVKAYAN